MQLDSQKLRRGIEKKGFKRITETKGKDLKYGLVYRGKFTPITTKVSKGTKPVKKNLLGKIRRQLFLHPYTVESFIECDPPYDGYIDHLVRNKIITISNDGNVRLLVYQR